MWFVFAPAALSVSLKPRLGGPGSDFVVGANRISGNGVKGLDIGRSRYTIIDVKPVISRAVLLLTCESSVRKVVCWESCLIWSAHMK